MQTSALTRYWCTKYAGSIRKTREITHVCLQDLESDWLHKIEVIIIASCEGRTELSFPGNSQIDRCSQWLSDTDSVKLSILSLTGWIILEAPIQLIRKYYWHDIRMKAMKYYHIRVWCSHNIIAFACNWKCRDISTIVLVIVI